MDFDAELSGLLGSLMKANNQIPFNHLTVKGGNEKEIEKVLEILVKVFNEKGYLKNGKRVEEHHQTLRKINFFLILNTDLKVLDDLVDNDDLSHVTWVAPTITKFLLIHLVWGLELDTFFCESIKYCCPKLSLELLDIASQNIKYSTPEQGIIRASMYISSAYEVIMRMGTSSKRESDGKHILAGVYDKISQFLKYFGDSPSKNKMSSWSRRQLYIHAGQVMLNIFDMCINSFKLFLFNPEPIAKELEIYLTTFGDNSDESFSEKKDGIHDKVREYATKINELLIETLKQNIMAINVDVFCTWHENNESNDSSKTLQRAVGEKAYELHNIMTSDMHFDNEVISMLPAIACKPEDLSDLINKADKETVLENAQKVSSDQATWIAALIKRNDLFSDEMCIQCVINNISLLSIEEKVFLFEGSINSLNTHVKCEFQKELKSLALKCVLSIPYDTQKRLIIYLFSKKGINNTLELPDYELKQKEFFNKLIEINEENLTELYYIFLQNPCKFYKTSFESCISNVQQTAVLLNSLEKLKLPIGLKFENISDEELNLSYSKMSELILSTLININLDSMTTDVERLGYVSFLKGIAEKDIVNGETIILLLLMPAIIKCLTAKNNLSLQLYLEALQEVFCIEKHRQYISSYLVMLAQIMERLRCDMSNFTSTAVEIIQLAIKLLTGYIDAYLNYHKPEDADYQWLLTNVSFLTPINAYYFQKLFPSNTFTELYDVTSATKQSFVSLCYLLPRSTPDEWKILCNLVSSHKGGVRGFHLVCCVLVAACDTAAEMATASALACLEYCCRNTATVLQDIVSSGRSVEEKLDLCRDIVVLANSLPEDIQTDCFNCFLTPLTTIIKNGETVSQEIFNSLKNDNSKNIVQKIFVSD